ncbi:MAG: hypothetical protein JXK93_09070, partial [Sphaerochaetaceae bacterium]|nr:hypothetical protein [Sphaerochaetaceae bacterium]
MNAPRREPSFAILGDGALTIEKAVANSDCILKELRMPGRKEKILSFIEKGSENRFPDVRETIAYVNQEYRKELKSEHAHEPYTNRLLPLAILTLILRLPVYVFYNL